MRKVFTIDPLQDDIRIMRRSKIQLEQLQRKPILTLYRDKGQVLRRGTVLFQYYDTKTPPYELNGIKYDNLDILAEAVITHVAYSKKQVTYFFKSIDYFMFPKSIELPKFIQIL